MPEPGEHLDLVLLELLARAAAVALLAPAEVGVDRRPVELEPGRQPGEDRDERRAVRLAGGGEAERHAARAYCGAHARRRARASRSRARTTPRPARRAPRARRRPSQPAAGRPRHAPSRRPRPVREIDHGLPRPRLERGARPSPASRDDELGVARRSAASRLPRETRAPRLRAPRARRPRSRSAARCRRSARRSAVDPPSDLACRCWSRARDRRGSRACSPTRRHPRPRRRAPRPRACAASSRSRRAKPSATSPRTASSSSLGRRRRAGRTPSRARSAAKAAFCIRGESEPDRGRPAARRGRRAGDHRSAAAVAVLAGLGEELATRSP